MKREKLDSNLGPWIERLNSLSGGAAAICIFAIAVIICYEIVSRFLFNAPTTWVLEISVYLSISAGFLGAAYTLQHNAHFSITIITQRLPKRGRRILRLVTTSMALIYCLVFAWKGYQMVVSSHKLGLTSESFLETPLWIPELVVPIGAILLIFNFVRIFIQDLTFLMAKPSK
jgi:TRAP-type C4-dicarboxylate transport system permease small subunit